MRHFSIALRIAVLAALIASADPATAADCGGERECGCGDRVVQDYRLPGDLGPCPEMGLEIGRPIVLDGGGHTIRGTGKGFGVRLGREASGGRVRNLRVTGFARGVRLQNVRNARVEDIEAFRNGDFVKHVGYGIDFAQGASANLVTRARVYDNADEGIHLGAHCRDNRIVDSEIWGNYRENVYFLANQGARLERSRLHSSGRGTANVYIKFSQNIVLEKNRIDGGTVQLRGGTVGVRLVDNTLNDADIILEEQRDRRFGLGRPVGTTIQGGRIRSVGTCVRVEAGSDVNVMGTDLQCHNAVAVAEMSDVALRDVDNARVRCRGPGTVRRLHSVDVRFVGPTGAPQPRVQLRARSGATLGEAGVDGRYRGPVEIARLSCPNGAWQPTREIEIQGGSVRESIAVDALRGTVALGGTRLPRSRN